MAFFNQALSTFPRQKTVADGLLPRIQRKIQQVYDKQVDGTGLAVFRIVFCSVLLAEIAHLFYFRALVFDPIPFVEPAELNVTGALLLWMVTVGCLILGVGTRVAAVVNYGFVLLFFSSMRSYLYMMTPVYVSLSFLFLVLPIGRCLSLDQLWRTLRYSTTQQIHHPSRTVSQLAYYVPVVVGIAFVYLDSTLYKLTAPLWLKGLGMWKPVSSAFEVPANMSFILNQEVLVKFLGYLTLAFEFFFLFLFPFRRYRVALFVIGIGLHVGVLVTFALPLFAIGFGSLYLLMVPASYWPGWLRSAVDTRLAGWLLRQPRLAAVLRAIRRPVPAESPNYSMQKLRRAGVTAGVVGLVLLQCAASYDASLMQLLRQKSGLDATAGGQVLGRVATATGRVARKFFGVTNHPIALDEHFAGYTRIIAITYLHPDGREEFLPIIRPDGQPGAYLHGIIWLKWTYNIVTRQIEPQRLEKGIRDFTAFWAVRHHLDLNNCHFRVKVKKIKEATDWQYDFLNQQRAARWHDAGTADWHNQQFSARLIDIQAL